MANLITGGAGFIGSHLADALIARGEDVAIMDDLSEGRMENVNKKARFFKQDITQDKLNDAFDSVDCLWHFAADPLVKESAEMPERSFRINVHGTFRVLEEARRRDVGKIVFASTSTVYGDAKIPTKEDAPFVPISNYGASKAANEAYVSSYCHTYGMAGVSLRYANIFGSRSRHGVMYDFFKKLSKNPKNLGILGDGTQQKSYLHISDCISATLIAANATKKKYDVFNVGSEKWFSVKKIAGLVCREMNVEPGFVYTGGKRGWVGDVAKMKLDIQKLKKLKWREKVPFEEGVSDYISWLESHSSA